MNNKIKDIEKKLFKNAKGKNFCQLIVETMSEGLGVLDENANIVYFNPKMFEMLGYDSKDIIGKHISCLISEKDKIKLEKHLSQRKEGLTDKFELEVVKKDGTVMQSVISPKPIVDKKGRFFGSFAIITDITEKKRIEEKLYYSETKFRELFNNINVGVAIYESSDNGKSFIFKDINKASEHIEKLKREELIGKNVVTVFPGVKDFGLLEVFQRVFKTGKSEIHPITLYKDDRLFGWRYNFVYKLPCCNEIVAVYTDETEKQNLKSQIKQIQKMDALGKFAGGIAHDFNNILYAISGFAELAQSSVNTESEADSHLNDVLCACKRAKGLINQILVFSRSNGQNKEYVNVKNVIKEAVTFIRALLPTNIEIKHKLESNAYINGNPTQLHQIILNISANAGHSMHDKGGVLNIELSDFEPDANFFKQHIEFVPGRYIKLAIEDNGCGMSSDVLKRIFEPFFTTKERGEGTGMGLSVVYGIVKSYKGLLEVDSEPRIGTKFTIYFPTIDYVEDSEEKIQDNQKKWLTLLMLLLIKLLRR